VQRSLAQPRRAILALPVLLAACMGTPKPQFSAADMSDIDRVSAYLNATTRFEARFTQTGAFGPGAGLVWLDRPGHLRIDYAGPGARVMVIGNGRVHILDRSNGATTTMPVSRTPLGILLAPQISLSGAVTVTALRHEAGGVQVSVQKTDQPGQGSLTLYFYDQPLRLAAVTVTDTYQRSLTLSLSDMNRNPKLTPDLFQPPVAGSGS